MWSPSLFGGMLGNGAVSLICIWGIAHAPTTDGSCVIPPLLSACPSGLSGRVGAGWWCKTKLMRMASEKGRVFHRHAFALKYAHGERVAIG